MDYPSNDLIEVLGEAFWSIAKIHSFTVDDINVLLGVDLTESQASSLEENNKLPGGGDSIQAALGILGIHKNLRQIFINNKAIVSSWFKTPSSLIGGETPLNYIRKNRVEALGKLNGLLNSVARS